MNKLIYTKTTHKQIFTGLTGAKLGKLLKICAQRDINVIYDNNYYCLARGNTTWKFHESTQEKYPAKYIKTTTEKRQVNN